MMLTSCGTKTTVQLLEYPNNVMAGERLSRFEYFLLNK